MHTQEKNFKHACDSRLFACLHVCDAGLQTENIVSDSPNFTCIHPNNGCSCNFQYTNQHTNSVHR